MNPLPIDSAANPWDGVSATFQRRRALSTHTVSLGGMIADALATSLLGDVRGKRILDLGCGGGQNCIALARQGAMVTGVDASVAQIDYARALATAEGFDLPFYPRDAVNLGDLADGSWDVALAIGLLQYLPDPAAALREAVRALAQWGVIIVSLGHPVRALFFDGVEEEWSAFPLHDYHSATAEGRIETWRYPDTDIVMTTWHHTTGEWVQMLLDAGLRLTALLEPPVPEELRDDLWPEDDALAPLRHIPHTLILVAQKPLP